MSTMSKLNFRETHFPHPTLTPIVGYPIYDTIIKMQEETISNLTSIDSTLSDGLNGHAGLGLSPTAYARGCSTPYHRPTKPAEYEAPADPSVLVQQREEKAYKKLVDEFNLVNHLERTCLNLIKAALDPKILRPKINRFNGSIKGTIPDLFKYLFKAYGNITNFTLETTRQNILALKYDHQDHLSNAFALIDDYATMSDAHGTSLSDEVLKGLAECVIMNANIYATDIQKWKESTYSTWLEYQEFFITAQEQYKESRPQHNASALGYTSPTPQANYVSSSSPADELRDAEAYIAALEAAQHIPPAPAVQPVTVQPVAAAVTPASNDTIIAQLLAQMEELKTQVSSKKHRNKREKDKPSKERLYCWTHGSCAHKSKDCNHPKDGHKKEATFSNMMGGSKKECYWIKDE